MHQTPAAVPVKPRRSILRQSLALGAEGQRQIEARWIHVFNMALISSGLWAAYHRIESVAWLASAVAAVFLGCVGAATLVGLVRTAVHRLSRRRAGLPPQAPSAWRRRRRRLPMPTPRGAQ